jgi:hypothetical protein
MMFTSPTTGGNNMDHARIAAQVTALGNLVASAEREYAAHMRVAKVAKDAGLASAHAAAAQRHYDHAVQARDAIDRFFDQVR